jgi:hypothetical protein
MDSRRILAGALLALVWAVGCDDVRRDWSSCREADCAPGFVCSAQRCVPVTDGGDVDGSALDVPPAVDLPLSWLDAGPADAPGTEAAEAAASVPIDAAMDAMPDMPFPTALDAAVDGGIDAPVDMAIDTRVPDARGTCLVDADCSGATPYCVDRLCVECRTSAECQGGSPICSSSHACVSCAWADGGCPANAPACEADSGRCVECVSNDGCAEPSRPICDSASHTCVRCSDDEQCAGQGPGVCMAHLDGRCATDAETTYVGSLTSVPCSDTATNAGTAGAPYCTVQRGVLAANAKGKALVLLSGVLAGGVTGLALSVPLAVVGRDAVINAADYSDGLSVTGGELYLRNLTVAGSASRQTGIGVNAQATPGASLLLRVKDCTITGNPGGGILLAGAAFDIENTVVSGNGPGETVGGVSFGGIRIDSMAAVGPATMTLVTITDNLAPGLSCAGGIQGTGVLSTGNTVQNIASSCGFVSCAAPNSTCGAQP